MESKPFETRDLPTMARERVQIGPVASWIDPCYYDKHFNPKIRGEKTHLLQELQIHAELGQTYVHNAVRLESQGSVQIESQWRLDFEPQTQSIVLHSIKIRRGEAETEHASLDRIQFLQRESGLERFVIHGSITLLLLLEDVRPGDVLEFSYTITNRPRLMPEYLTAFFTLPAAAEIGKYRFLIRHAERRAVKWKASSPKFIPKITTENGEVCCYWMDAQFVSPEPEGGAPAGHIMFPWIQVSDCPDWQTVARAVLEAWEKIPPGENLTSLIEEITNSSPELPARVTRAIELVQDSFRYLSVNLEFGGYVPAAAGTVVRRRYGDCKDLAFLLVQLLRALGVPARPVWVHAHLRKSIGSMLPALQMFNHVVVEYEIENEKRWVDGTAKNQGGGALNRSITDFGLGLPIDAGTTELAPVPKASLAAGTYEIKESVILDTAGKPSYLAIVITTTGAHADAFRDEFTNKGIDVIAKDRLQLCANRFTKASRTRAMGCRDDRLANEFVLAEAFEIPSPILAHQASNTCLFTIRSDLTAGIMVNPGLATRRHPLALPFPCHRTHTIEIEFAGLNSISVPLFQLGNKYFTFSRRNRCWPNLLKVTFSLEALGDSIPPDKLGEHRKNVEAIHEAGAIHLQLPMGYSRSRIRSDFGALPPPTPSRIGVAGPGVVTTQKPVAPNSGVDVPVPTMVPESVAVQKTAELAAPKPMPPAREGIQSQAAPEKPRTHHRRSYRRSGEKRCAISFSLIVVTILTLGIADWVSSQVSKTLGGSLLLLVVIPVWILSLVLAVLGWIDLAKSPDHNLGNSKVFAVLTLVFGCLLGLVLVPAMIIGFRTGLARAQSHLAYGNGEPLDFKEQNFIFHSPAPPWHQVDAKTFAQNAIVSFARPDPMYFKIVADRVELMMIDPRKRVVELSKNGLRRSLTSYHLVNEQEVTYNGLAGWQTETEGSLQGHDLYFVQWIFATNGIGYQLTAWGPPTVKKDLKDESSRLFADFELTPPQHDSASSINP